MFKTFWKLEMMMMMMMTTMMMMTMMPTMRASCSSLKQTWPIMISKFISFSQETSSFFMSVEAKNTCKHWPDWLNPRVEIPDMIPGS